MATNSTGDVRKLFKELERQGWRIRMNKHYVLYPPDKAKKIVVMPVSGGGGRGWQNALAALRKSGADV